MKLNKTFIFITSVMVMIIGIIAFDFVKVNIIDNPFFGYKNDTPYFETEYIDISNTQIGIKIIPIKKMENVNYYIGIVHNDGEIIQKEYKLGHTLDPDGEVNASEGIFKNMTHQVGVLHPEKVYIKIEFIDFNGYNRVEKIKVAEIN